MHSNVCKQKQREKLANTNLNETNVNFLRGIAIILVISCHSCHLSSTTDYNEYSKFMSLAMQSVGTIGVAIFFFLAGYFYAKTGKKSLVEFFQSRRLTIILPWFVTASAVYFWGVIRKGGFNLFFYIKDILGIGSYTWYLAVLMLLYLNFWRVRKNSKVLWVLLFCSILLKILQDNLIKVTVWSYFSPFIWIPFFCFGAILTEKVALTSNNHFRNRRVYTFLLLIPLIVTIITAYNDIQIAYWDWYYQIYAFSAIIGLTGLALDMDFIKANFLQEILYFSGKISFSIYLLHMPFAGIIAALANRLAFSPIIIRPFLVLLLTLCAIWLYRTLARMMRIPRISDILIGFREERIG